MPRKKIYEKPAGHVFLSNFLDMPQRVEATQQKKIRNESTSNLNIHVFLRRKQLIE